MEGGKSLRAYGADDEEHFGVPIEQHLLLVLPFGPT